MKAKRGAPATLGKLGPKQQRFVGEYLVDLNASAAARRAGYSARTAEQQGPRLLGNVGVAAAIAQGRAKVAEKLEVSAERVIGEAWRILTADARELVEHRVDCCRYCWGIGHRYQRTAAEQAPDADGGIGFDPRRDPNPDCPECFGRGQGRTMIRDTRRLSPAAAALYAGIRQTRDGFQVLMHSKVDALDRLFRHLGLADRLSLNPEVVDKLKADSGLTLADRGRAILGAAAAGAAPVSQAAQLLTGLGTLAKLIETDELAARIAALEKRAAEAPE